MKDAENVKDTISLFEIKRHNSGEVLIYLTGDLIGHTMPSISFSCLDKNINYKNDNDNYIKEILLSKTCQKAIQEFNMPLSKEDINNLVVTEGCLN